MNIEETGNALGLAQAFDNRTVGETNLLAWYEVLRDLEADDVMRAIREHYATHTTWIMPAHIRAAVDGYVKARNVGRWAPGQHGVSRTHPLPEVTDRVRDAGDLNASVREMLARLREILPEGRREDLFPRRVEWGRAHAAYQRSQDGQPNPHYRPKTEEERRTFCRETGAHDTGMHVVDCPDAALRPEDYQTSGAHRHSASCHGAIGELLCGHP